FPISKNATYAIYAISKQNKVTGYHRFAVAGMKFDDDSSNFYEMDITDKEHYSINNDYKNGICNSDSIKKDDTNNDNDNDNDNNNDNTCPIGDEKCKSLHDIANVIGDIINKGFKNVDNDLNKINGNFKEVSKALGDI